MHSFVQPVALKFAGISDAGKAFFMKAYMKNRFDFFGIQTRERRKFCKDYMKQNELKSEEELEAAVKDKHKHACTAEREGSGQTFLGKLKIKK